LLTQKFGTVYYDDERLLQAYVNTKQWDRVIGIWSARAQKSPNDANIHMGLASAYFSSGNKTKTLAELDLVSKLNPAATAQVESLIHRLKTGH
jgi:Flp pilus assembly protein TadD